ncbi:hypothetical protein QQ045_002249 [Rhodiola kirilowii]
METERVVEFPIVNIDKRPRKRQRLGWDVPTGIPDFGYACIVMHIYFYGHVVGNMINVMPSMALSLDIANRINMFSHGLPNVLPRSDSPPWRKDGKDGHYTFVIGDNLTPRYKIQSKMGEGFGQAGIERVRGVIAEKTTASFIINAVIYESWRARNRRIFLEDSSSEEQLMARIWNLLRLKLELIRNTKTGSIYYNWFESTSFVLAGNSQDL